MRKRPRIAVIGHVQHVAIGRTAALPKPGEIVHLDDPIWIPGGGGGIAFFQLVRSPADLHLFTALGDDTGGDAVYDALRGTGAAIHASRRGTAHARDLVLITPDGERTIFVIDAPLHARRDDALPWELLATCDAVFFTGQDPEILAAARAARTLVVTARRAEALARSGVGADVVVGSASDPREMSTRADYPVPPGALVMTEGRDGGRIETDRGLERFPAAPPPPARVGAYGAGDSFAAALTWYLVCGLSLLDACSRGAEHGAAVLAGVNPLENQRPLTWPADAQGRGAERSDS